MKLTEGLDMEFTGLHSTFLPRQPSLFDSPAEWYQKARQSVQQFTVSQLGLSIFSNEKSNKYVAHSYNFFLFPTTFGQMDSEVCFQTSSIQFLSHYGFDYNKFLKDGIPYMNEAQEEKLQQQLLPGSWMISSGFERNKLKRMIDEVTCWVSLAEEKDSMVLHDIYGFQMFEIQLILRQAFQDIWTVPLGDQEVMVKKMSPRHRWLLENTCYDSCQREQILFSARGFTNLFQILVKAKKPLVGHNMLMDLLHLHEKFYNPLPEKYEEFKKNIHALFPVIMDTKNIAKAIWKEFQFPRAGNLLEVYEVLCSDMNPTSQPCPEIFHANDSLRYATKKSPHEAAYDAFLCGSVLLKIAHLLLDRISCDPRRTTPSFSEYLDVLAAYVNQVNLIRAGVQKINFYGMDGPTKCPPLLIVNVRGWTGVNEEQIYRELKIFCRFDVRRLRMNQFLLLSNNFKDVRTVLRECKAHPNLQISLYHRWRHSPQVNFFLQICGIVASWSLLAFFLGGSSNCAL
ncbi:poly(A)-specific ribonuclease PNLDC1 isoform X2 [Rhineura floridana]|uniref:poly(A)-specific ribonuclease PNLDC1 isoform X2 n=1 Tax=Rhineura floridana TaxID=261503 RepID=UPI002AC81ECE|nr:poly(A)-specific ribonuclease PNLDC1 isoform X2 [Rhineura floridana]XP_061482349.1 poly(A)-specific ribonuclease PNLDC1 isoform X2 [Rhineura floridana]